MAINKREFLKLSGATAGSGLVLAACGAGTTAGRAATLRPLTDDVVPITVEERLARVAKAQSLMAEHGLAALIIEPGSAMLYFSGIRWRRSERLTALVIPREGDIAVVTPYFEEPSVRESMTCCTPRLRSSSRFASLPAVAKTSAPTACAS